MILIDASILLHSYDSSSPRHEAARRWLEELLSQPEPVGLTWQGILAFLRVTTNSGAVDHPWSLDESLAIVSSWLERPAVTILAPGERHFEILRKLISEGQAFGRLAADADLAALAIEHGATLSTSDREFTRFPGLRTLNPFAT
ncbi:MAG: TA system VapC family ribonuclease toxin [Terriglobia bacterium]